MNESPEIRSEKNGTSNSRKARRIISNLTRPLLLWIYFKFLFDEQYMGRVKQGIRDGLWAYLCGWSLKEALHIANIWWRVGRK